MCLNLIFWLMVLFTRAVVYERRGFFVDAIIVAAFFYEGYENSIGIEVHWGYLPFYALFSIFLFLASLWVTSSEPLSYLSNIVHFFGHRYWNEYLGIAKNSFLVAAYEELIWRVLLQSALSHVVGVALSVVLVAVTFTAWHWHRVVNYSAQQFELLMFSLILGSLFSFLHDPLLLLLSHSLRNYLIESHHLHVRAKNAH